jgi:branched-chain amino acid transport system permease protein
VRDATVLQGDRSPLVARVFAVLVVAVAAVPLIGEYQALVGILAVVFGLVALGYVVLTGWAGQLSLGQVVPYGLGGYAVAFLADKANVPVAIAIPLAAICVVPAAALIGWAADRLRGLDLAIGTFALALAFQFLAFGSLSRTLAPDTAGSASVVQVARPNLWSLELDSNRSFYLYALALGAIAYVLVAALGRSATGRELLAVGDDPTRASVTGIQVGRLRVLAFVVGGGLAALGGALLVSAREAVTPETFTAFESLNLLALAVVGGLASARGAIIGGAVGAVLPELARVDPFRFLQGRLTLVYGIALVIVLAAKRGGLVALIGLDRRGEPELRGDGVPASGAARAGSDRAALRVDELVVDYGAARAVDGVSLRVDAGESVALVGPNGAGKSSVFDVVTGLLAPTSGRVYLGGLDVTQHRPEQRAGLGLGRTFQAARVFASLSVGENLLAAAHRGGRRDAPSVAGELLDRLALRDVETALPAELPFGSLRLLEVGLALAGRPHVLLLDEPAAGLDPADLDRLAVVLDDIRRTDVSILVVDHDLGFVGRVADRVVVLDQGRVIADGTPRVVARSRRVIEAFLGTAAKDLGATRRTRRARRRKETAGAARA